MTQVKEIERIYNQCGIQAFEQTQIRNGINKGSLSNKLNSGFSNMYNKRNSMSSLSGSTTRIS